MTPDTETSKKITAMSNITDQMVKDFLGELSQPWIKKEWLDKWEQFKSSIHTEVEGEVIKVRYKGAIFFFPTGRGYTMEELNRNGYEIYSVRRLSDGIVFTINDYVEFCANDAFAGQTWLARIDSIEIRKESNELVFVLKGDSEDDIFHKFIQNIRPAPKEEKKPVLFTTEDGKDVYEDDKVWYVNGILKVYSHDFIVSHPSTREKDLTHYPDIYKYFSSEEAANEYVKYNRKDYSLNDIKNAWSEGRSFVGTDWLIEQLLAITNTKGGGE
jgi:hypothetical protein